MRGDMPAPSDGRRNWLRVFAGLVAIWAFLVGLILFELVPYAPRTPGGWTVLLLAGPPAYLAVSWLGERVLGPRLPRITPTRFSLAWFAWMRVAVVTGSAFVALSAWLSLRFGR